MPDAKTVETTMEVLDSGPEVSGTFQVGAAETSGCEEGSSAGETLARE